MKAYSIPYGHGHLMAEFSDEAHVDVLLARQVSGLPNADAAVTQLIDGVAQNAFKNCSSHSCVSIAVNDKTRPVPHSILLPPLLHALEQAGVLDEHITFFIATGTHLPIQPFEFRKSLPDSIISRYRVESHDARDAANLRYLGETKRHTPVWVNQRYYESDLKIVVGNIEPHHFMGFSGGGKGAAVGLAGWETINTNHAMMMDAQSYLGNFESNPVRQDVEDIGQMMGVHLALNAVLNQQGDLVNVFFGEPRLVIEQAIPLVRDIFSIEIESPYDFIIASPGGYPRDINLYQAEKALSDATLMIKKNGIVLLAAACSEGTGSQGYETWMKGISTFEEVFDRFGKEDFRIGPHKAYQIARDTSRTGGVLLLSDMSQSFARQLLFNPVQTVGDGIKIATKMFGQSMRAAVIPLANSMIPVLNYHH